VVVAIVTIRCEVMRAGSRSPSPIREMRGPHHVGRSRPTYPPRGIYNVLARARYPRRLTPALKLTLTPKHPTLGHRWIGGMLRRKRHRWIKDALIAIGVALMVVGAYELLTGTWELLGLVIAAP
jgi:hypothetical protein